MAVNRTANIERRKYEAEQEQRYVALEPDRAQSAAEENNRKAKER